MFLLVVAMFCQATFSFDERVLVMEYVELFVKRDSFIVAIV